MKKGEIFYPAVAFGALATVADQIAGGREQHIHMDYETQRIVVPQVAAVTTGSLSAGVAGTSSSYPR